MPGEVEIIETPAQEGFKLPGRPDPYSEFEPKFKLENVEIEEPAAGPSEKELRELFEAEKKKNEELAKKASEAGNLGAGFDRFAERLEQVIQRPVPQAPAPPAPGESFEEFKARVEKNFIEKPFESIEQVVQRSAGPAFAALGSTIAKQSKTIARLTADDPSFFQKYEAEIDEYVGQMDPRERVDPMAYQKAYDLVKVRHLDEIIERRAQAKAQAAGVQMPAQAQAPAQRAAPAMGFSPESGQSQIGATPVTPTPQAPGKIRITRAQADYVRSRMMQADIPDEQFELTVELMRERGEI